MSYIFHIQRHTVTVENKKIEILSHVTHRGGSFLEQSVNFIPIKESIEYKYTFLFHFP